MRDFSNLVSKWNPVATMRLLSAIYAALIESDTPPSELQPRIQNRLAQLRKALAGIQALKDYLHWGGELSLSGLAGTLRYAWGRGDLLPEVVRNLPITEAWLRAQIQSDQDLLDDLGYRRNGKMKTSKMMVFSVTLARRTEPFVKSRHALASEISPLLFPDSVGEDGLAPDAIRAAEKRTIQKILKRPRSV